MARNASGTYSLPTGNPVVTGTSISSTVHNNTNTDMATEITNSISVSHSYTITGDWTHQGDITWSGANTFTGVLGVQTLQETPVAVASSGGTATFDFSAGTYFTITLSENTTFAFTNLPVGKKQGITIEITQDSTARTVTYPAGTKAQGGTAPVVNTTSGHIDFVTVHNIDGTNVFASNAGQGYATIS